MKVLIVLVALDAAINLYYGLKFVFDVRNKGEP